MQASPARMPATAGTWFMYEPAMKAMNGDPANRQRAPSATPRRGSAARISAPNAPTATAPAIGPTSHGTRSTSPIASIADHPGGNCPYVLPPASTTLASEKNAGSACVGRNSRPPAKMRACSDCTSSSINSGRPSNTDSAITAYSTSEASAMPTVTRAGARSHRSASASHTPARQSHGMRRDAIASTTPTPSTIAVPLSHPSRKAP